MIYTDSIPLFAVFFKIFSPVLPHNFQYFGLFGIMCYALQGGCGALKIKKTGGNTVQSLIGSLFFVLSTVMMYRIFGHTSLSAHFLILLCILLCLENQNNFKKQIIAWSSLLALNASIHLYFVPMTLIFMAFYLLHEYIKLKNLKNLCIILGLSVFALIGTMFCFGAFYFIKDVSADLLGESSANLNAFVNPQGESRFIKDMPLATNYQYEGNSYLGLGIILILFVILIFTLHQKNKKEVILSMKTGLNPYIFGIILFFLLFSLSPSITFNQYKLFTYPMFNPVERMWSIFRSTGRFTWSIIYIIITICIWWIITRFSVKKSLLVLCAILLIQWADLIPWFINKGDRFNTRVTYQSKLVSPAWNKLANEYKHIFFMDDLSFLTASEKMKLYSFLDLSGNNKMTVNDAYLARNNYYKINENRHKEFMYLVNNGPRNKTLYIFKDEEQALLFKESGINYYIIDEIIIGIDSKKEYLDDYEFYPLH
jgi:hypothetical protein